MGVKTSITSVYQVVLYEDIYGRLTLDPTVNVLDALSWSLESV